MDFDNLKKFINIVPNIENNIALICYNSCNLNTDGLINNTDLIINSIIPNPDSDTTNPIITIKNNNKLFITFNDIEDKNNKYEFKFITFVKDLEEMEKKKMKLLKTEVVRSKKEIEELSAKVEKYEADSKTH